MWQSERVSELTADAHLRAASSSPSLASIHHEHADFVWRALQRFGVRPSDLEDVYQEVFVVVHRRLDSYDGRSAITTWLYGICFRVAAGQRRRAHHRRERLESDLGSSAELVDQAPSPEQQVERREATERLNAVLDTLSLEQRAVLVMFELEGLGCEEIAGIVGVPLGTIFSRLHSARKAFARSLARLQARDSGGAK